MKISKDTYAASSIKLMQRPDVAEPVLEEQIRLKQSLVGQQGTLRDRS